MNTGVYQKTAGDLIRSALRSASISGIDLPVSGTDFAQGQEELNDVLAALQADQIHLWSETEALLPLNPGQARYDIPGAHVFTDYAYTTTTAANEGPAILSLGGDELLELDSSGNVLSFNDTRIRVESTEGIEVGCNAGIELPNGTRWWATVSQVDAAESWFQVEEEFISFINEGATIYVYCDAIDMPVRVCSARHAEGETFDEIPTRQLARQEYFDEPTKTSQGAVNSWYYSRQINEGHLYVWPVASNCNQVLRFTFIKPQYIPENQSDQILIPPEWYLPLKLKLAAELGSTYQIDDAKQTKLEVKAQNWLEMALGSDNEYASFSFYPGEY